MVEVNMFEGMTPEGEQVKETAMVTAEWLRQHLTPEFVDAAKASGLIDDEGAELLSECLQPENYMAKGPEQRAHVDQLIESLKEAPESL